MPHKQEVNGVSGGEVKKADGLSGLQSSKTYRRLKQIADLRARGIGNHIALPQLVVGGDQSTGKSSVLEGITSIPFPREEGVCTKFATEIILQPSNGEETILATIIPADSRSDELKLQLKAFERHLQSFTELADTIADAGALMGIRGFREVAEGPAFADDVLRIEVSRPDAPTLTVVDVPGLIQNVTEGQTQEDVDMVKNLVESYVSNPRTIILAVAQAGNDIANQPIIKLARQHDSTGKRTVGIITKPDLINRGAEPHIASLVKNLGAIKLNLGYFIVKNPAPVDRENGISWAQRKTAEKSYFSQPPWKGQNLPQDRVGIEKLSTYLQTLLDQYIEHELPHIRKEIGLLLEETERELRNFGEERNNAAQCRMYLLRLATSFKDLVSSALNGSYNESDSHFFGKKIEEADSRLRALVHKLNTQFSDSMRDYGARRKIAPEEDDTDTKETCSQLLVSEDDTDTEETCPQLLVSEDEMKQWVKEIYVATRGKELPGTYGYVLLAELFAEHSSRWRQIAMNHIDNMASALEHFVEHALKHAIKDEKVLADIIEITTTGLQKRKKRADKELEMLWLDEMQQPITYNHYFTDNVQKARYDGMESFLEKMVEQSQKSSDVGRDSFGKVDPNMLLRGMKRTINVNMDDQACSEALKDLEAYYKVAQKTFVDNVCRQVIERRLLRDLPNIFCPETVAAMSDEDLELIAGEKQANIMKRKELKDRRLQLNEGLKDLRK